MISLGACGKRTYYNQEYQETNVNAIIKGQQETV